MGVGVFGWSLVVTATSNFKLETTTGRLELVLLGFESLERVEFKTNGFRRNKATQSTRLLWRCASSGFRLRVTSAEVRRVSVTVVACFGDGGW